jgi:hypothetical protein
VFYAAITGMSSSISRPVLPFGCHFGQVLLDLLSDQSVAGWI